ncbi:hypothetical protein AB0L65_11005 [Nonomuraea sp. NPDC052116]|uniref:hypothetical protein n=1 Tax=Nonomuraea sp. NPDC052116 TaxID=3155665 RepID=UPI0034343F9F
MAVGYGDYATFTASLGGVLAAATVLPYAYPIAGLMGLLVSDPAAQYRAADQWLNETPVGMGPEKGSTAQSGPAVHKKGVSDLAYLRSELKRLSKDIGESEEWLGRGYNSFLKKVEELDGHLDTLDRNRVDCGNTLRCSALAFRVLEGFCALVSACLVSLAMYVAPLRLTPAGPSAEAVAINWVTRLHNVMAKILENHLKLVVKGTLILAGGSVIYNQLAHELPGMRPVSLEKPKLLDAKAMWNAADADISDDPESKLDTGALKQPSLLPEIGW